MSIHWFECQPRKDRTSRLRRVLLLCSLWPPFLLTLDAQAATRVVALNGSCANHGGIGGSSFTSCADSRTAGCTAARPCCTLNEALRAAVSGDTIEVHHGTYSYSAANCADDIQCVSMTSPSHGPVEVAAQVTVSSVTIRSLEPDAPVLDLQNELEVGVWISDFGTTVSGLTIVDAQPTLADTHRLGLVTISDWTCCYTGGLSGVATPSAITLDGLTLNVTNETTSNVNLSAVRANPTPDNLVIKGSTIEGVWPVGIWLQDGLNGSAGAAIFENTFLGSRQGSSKRQVGLLLEHLGQGRQTGTLSVRDNVIDFRGSSVGDRYGLYPRENPITTYIFNNRILNATSGVYYQEGGRPAPYNDSVETLLIFNNYMTGVTAGVLLYNCTTTWIRNNVFKGFSFGVKEAAGDSTVNTTTVCTSGAGGYFATTPASGDISYNMCVNVATCVREDEPNITVSDNTSTSSLLDEADGHLRFGSPAIDAGMNNPANLGPNVCAVSGSTTPVPFNCLSDIDGNLRPEGPAWDIGADEYSTQPASTPPPVQNVHFNNTR